MLNNRGDERMEKKKLLKKKYMFILLISIFLAFSSVSTLQTSNAASTVAVNTTGNDANTGTAINPYQTISTGINKVADKGTVKLSSGTFDISKDTEHTDYGIIISKNVTIQGSGSTSTIIDAKGLSTIFTIKNSNVVIRDLTIKNGKSLNGGAITNNAGSHLTLINCILINNVATNYGGAIYNSGNLNITSSTLAANSVTTGYGSAVYNRQGSAEIHFNSIFGNTGNAIYSDYGTVNAQNNWWGTNDNPSTPGSELEAFEDLNNWSPTYGATISTDTINGDTGIKVGGSAGNYPSITKNVNYNFNGTAPNIQLWLNVNDTDYDAFSSPNNLVDIGINFLTPTDGKYFGAYLIKSQLHKGLNYIVIPSSAFISNGGITWNDTITAVQYRLYYATGKTMNVTFLEMKNNLNGIPRMVLTFDDGYTSIYTTAFPIMKLYGIVGTVYVNTALVGTPGRLTLQQLHDLYDAGWTIANHTPNHTNLVTGSLTNDPSTTVLTVDQVKAIVQPGIDWLLANGFTRGAYDFALPFGLYNDNVLEALKELGIRTDRTVMIGMTAIPADDLLEISPQGPNGDGYPNGGNYTTFAKAKTMVDNTIAAKVSTFFMMHEITATPASGLEWAIADFTQFIQYLVQTNIVTESVDQWYTDIQGLTSGEVNCNPWIVLNSTTSQNTLNSLTTSTITADLTHNSNGEDISSQGHIPDGIITKITSDSLGTISPINPTTLNGKATTTYTAGTQNGTSNVKVQLNSVTENLYLNTIDTYAPVVTKMDPVNGAVNVGINKVIVVTFNEKIKAGNMWIELRNSAGNLVPVKSIISGNLLIISPDNPLTNGKDRLTLHSNSVSDMYGNMIKICGSSFTVDSISPVVSKTDPLNRAVNVAVKKVIKVSFSEPIKAGKIWIELKDSTGKIIKTSTTIKGNILTITHSSLLKKGTKYTLIIHSNTVKDLAGNPLRKAFSTTFTTTKT
jgi:peptidoglycan/xylan/chitin deacetylase (PgdA/CDA1 family)/methionine-rich copper-binding protein CopC